MRRVCVCNAIVPKLLFSFHTLSRCIHFSGVAVMTDAVLKGRKMWAIQLALLFSAGSLAMFYITSGNSSCVFFSVKFCIILRIFKGWVLSSTLYFLLWPGWLPKSQRVII